VKVIVPSPRRSTSNVPTGTTPGSIRSAAEDDTLGGSRPARSASTRTSGSLTPGLPAIAAWPPVRPCTTSPGDAAAGRSSSHRAAWAGGAVVTIARATANAPVSRA
jgi:hypothetical protein